MYPLCPYCWVYVFGDLPPVSPFDTFVVERCCWCGEVTLEARYVTAPITGMKCDVA